MGKKELHPILARDPVAGGPLYISELTAEDADVVIRGRFEVPRFARLDGEQTHLLETFLRSRGNITVMEKELGMSYPTVRARLDALLVALDLKPIQESVKKDKDTDRKRRILEMLENGEISAEEAKAKLKENG